MATATEQPCHSWHQAGKAKPIDAKAPQGGIDDGVSHTSLNLALFPGYILLMTCNKRQHSPKMGSVFGSLAG